MNTFPKRLATGIAALVTAFAFMVGGFVGQPAANAVPADSYAPTIVDECGKENDSITFPATLEGQTVTNISVGGEDIKPGETHNPLPEMVRYSLEHSQRLNYNVELADGQVIGYYFDFGRVLNDDPCPVPVEATLQSCDAETATILVTGTHVGDVKATSVQANGDHDLGVAFQIPLATLEMNGNQVNVRLENNNFASVPVEGVFSQCKSETDEPEGPKDPVLPDLECAPGENGAPAPWDNVPATFTVGDVRYDVYYMVFENAAGTSFQLTPGLDIESGSKVVEIYATDGTLLWNCSTDDPKPVPEDNLTIVIDDPCGTENDRYQVVAPAGEIPSYEGREVVKVQMSGDYDLGEWIPYDADLVEMVGGVQVVLDNGNFAVIPFDPVFTDEPCEETPEEPADDDSAQDPTDAETDDPAKDEGKKLPKTGVELTTFASLMALFGFAGAAGIAVARKRA